MTTVTFLIVLTLCSLVRAGELADLHRELVPGTLGGYHTSRSHDEVASTNHGITEMGIERTACFGACPIYTFIVKNDGTFRYTGEEHVDRKGAFTGRIQRWYFNNLAQFLKDAGYAELEDAYTRRVTDHPTVYTTVVLNGKRKLVRNHANAGPTKLWAIEQLIDSLLSEAEWDEKPTSPEKK